MSQSLAIAARSVALISYHTCPLASEEGKETGGMNVYVLELAKALGALGWQVNIFTRAQEASNPPTVSVTKSVTLWHVMAGPATSLSKNDSRTFVSEFADNVYAICKTEQLRFDVIHAHYYLSGLAAQELQVKLASDNKRKTPIILTYHTMALMKNLVARSESEREDAVRLKAEFGLAASVDQIIAPSEIEADYLTALLGAKPTTVSVVPPGVDLTMFRPINQATAKANIGADPDHKVILFAGRIEPLKGLDSLLYAIKVIKNRHPKLKVCLWVVGGDISQPDSMWSAELKRINELKKLLGLTSEVKFVGQQHQTQLPYYYNAAEVVVMPSHYESFGMVAAEAMACGVPVLTTNVAGIAERLDEQHSQLITTAQHPLLLAEQIAHFALHPEARQATAQNLRAKVSDLEWSQVATKIVTIYEKVSSSVATQSAQTQQNN